jgi:hypothetical protein
MLTAGGVVVDHGGAALVILVFAVHTLQQFIHLLQDIGGQHIAKSTQKVWDFFILIHN